MGKEALIKNELELGRGARQGSRTTKDRGNWTVPYFTLHPTSNGR